MRLFLAFKKALSLSAPALLLCACQPSAVSQTSDLDTGVFMLTTSAVSQGCTFTIAVQSRGGFPPLYDYVVTRQASGTCAYPAASTTVGSSYYGSAGITGNDLGIAVGIVTKGSPSGSSPRSVYIKQIAVDTLGVVRSSGLQCGPVGMVVPSTSLGDLFMLNGTTVQVNGGKGCSPLAGQTEYGTGSNFYAYYFNFFTTTDAPIVIAY
ncbi:MAG TPA: hypothetical protein VFA20_12425 [Myxococcaceae bacterium]|nr:hypothetical protein [Myxococcaceae bacterium]